MIGIALALPACLHLLVSECADARPATGIARSISRCSSSDRRRPRKRGASAERIRQRRDVAEVELIPADEALKEFRRDSGFGDGDRCAERESAAAHADRAARRRRTRPRRTSQSLAADIRALPSVEVVQLDTAWVNRLNAILEAVQRGAGPGRRPARARRDGDRRQHDPAGHPEPPRRNRGHQAGRRQRRVRASAVSLQRRLVRAGRRRHRLADHRSSSSASCASPSAGSPASTAAVSSSAAWASKPTLILLAERRRSGLAGVLHRRHPAPAGDRAHLSLIRRRVEPFRRQALAIDGPRPPWNVPAARRNLSASLALQSLDC